MAPSEDEVKRMKRLCTKRLVIFSRLESLNAYLTTSNVTLKGLHVRLSKIESDWDDFDAIQSSIEELLLDNESALGKEVVERSRFEALYFDAVGKAEDARARLTPLPPSHPSTPPPPAVYSSGESFNDIKLPVINLPTFTGKYDEWYSFYNLFIDVIGSNKNASDLKKFKYLKTYLRGEPLELIDSLEPIDDSYEVALDLLKKRYDNPVTFVIYSIYRK
uniref:Uncharacterized protein n=1 Tax=Lygus hesperus TaxID=30085 RepID=A0A146LHJ1_LYGHE